MKILKKLILGASLVLGLSFVASCSNQNEITHIDMTEEEDEFQFTSIDIVTTNAKTTFYLGESFNYDGLVVNANFTKKAASDEEEAEYKTETITTYTVNTEFVDMNTVGRYVVYVKGRYEMKSIESTYIITVVSSQAAESGEAYLTGLEVTLNTKSTGYVNGYSVTFKKGEEFVLPTVSAYRAIYFKGTEISEADCSSVNVNAINVDSSAVNTAVKGSYTIIYSLTRGGVTVKSFVIVIVTDPVTEIEFKSGTVSQEASVYGFDYSNWVFDVKEESGNVSEMTYNEEYFTVANINALITNEYTAKVSYTDADGTVTTEVLVEVTPSSTQTIITETNLASTVGATSRVKLGETNYFFANCLDTTSAEKESTYDYVNFGYRYSLGGAGDKTRRNVEIYMPNAGTIVLYYGTSSGGTARAIECQYEDGEIVGQATSILTQEKAIFEVSQAGRYYFYSVSGGMYVYGITIAYDNEGAIEPEPAKITNLEVTSGITHYVLNGSNAGLNEFMVKATFDDNTSKIYSLADDELSITGLDLTRVGFEDLTITFDDGFSTKTTTAKVEVVDRTLSSVEFVSGTTTQRASMGGMNVSDYKLKATYSDSTTKELTFAAATDYKLSYVADNQTVGNKKMTIKFVDNTLETKEVSVNINIIKMSKDNLYLTADSIDSLGTPTTADLVGDLGNGFSVPMGTTTTTDGKSNTELSESKKSLNGFDFGKRLSLKTKGTTAHNNINFTAKAGAKVVVYALASSAGKSIYLSADGNAIYDGVSYAVSTTELTCYEFEVKADGKYYLIANNAAYIFYLGVEYDQLAATDIATAASMELFTPYGNNNTITVEQNATFDIKSVVLAITYSDNAITYLRIESTTYSATAVDLTTVGKYNVAVSYGTLSMTLVIDVVAPSN